MKKKRQEKAKYLQNADLSKKKCCGRRKCFSRADKIYLKDHISRVLGMTASQRRKYLECLVDGSTGLLMFNGIFVSYKFLETTFGFSRDMQGSVKGTPNSRKLQTRMNFPRDSESKKRDAIICFLERLAESTADKMPDRHEQHLPYFQKRKFYELMIQEYQKLHSGEPPTESYFYITWSKYVPHVKVRKVQRFTVCTECDEIRDSLAKGGTDIAATVQLRDRKREHMEMVGAESREYQKKCEQAALYPGRFCSLVINGADQSASGLPHLLHNTKSTKGHSLKVRLIGVLEHAAIKNLSLYTMTEEFETGANHIIESVHRTLMLKWLKSPLPRVLYFQMDNCTRENKNRFVFDYLESLVALGVFEEVYASFLPIGHTHSDIDQAFSCTANHLRHNEAITMEELIRELGQSYKPTPTVSRMLHVINFSALCKQKKCLRNVKNFSQYRYFRLHRVEGEPEVERDSFKTGCSVRIGCRDEWSSLWTEHSNMGFIKFSPDLSKTPPTHVTSPDNLEEVTKRFRSEETRINSTRKLRELRELRDEVYNTRKERFHSNLGQVYEMKGRFRKKSAQERAEGEIALEPSGMEEQTADRIRAEKDLEYNVSEFVAVKCEGCTEDMPFWIGRIKEVHKNDDCVIVSLYVHWHEVYNRKSAFRGKYAPSYLHKSTKPWCEAVEVDIVLTEFSGLSKKRTIGAKVEKETRRALGIP